MFEPPLPPPPTTSTSAYVSMSNCKAVSPTVVKDSTRYPVTSVVGVGPAVIVGVLTVGSTMAPLAEPLHPVHALAPAALHPSVQGVHAADPAAAKFPSRHPSQTVATVAPTTADAVPPGQSVHAVPENPIATA